MAATATKVVADGGDNAAGENNVEWSVTNNSQPLTQQHEGTESKRKWSEEATAFAQ